MTRFDVVEQPRSTSDHLLAAVAARQHGVVARWQLLEDGLTAAAIRHRVESGRLHPLGRGVYAVGHTALTQRGRLMAEVLAGGPGAVAWGDAAGWLWNGGGALRIEVCVEGRTRRKGIRVVRSLPPADRAVRDGIPCTSWQRTLRDLACHADEHRLRRLIERLIQDGHFDLRTLDTSRRPRLRAVLAEIADEPDGARSEAEARLFARLRRQGLPEPRRNVPVAGHLCDFVWLAERYVLELDSRWHGGPWRHTHDRRRDRDVRDAGFVVDRVTVDDPADEVAALVARRIGR